LRAPSREERSQCKPNPFGPVTLARPDKLDASDTSEFECWPEHVPIADIVPLCAWQWAVGMGARRISIAGSELEWVAGKLGYIIDAQMLIDLRIVINEMVRLDAESG
jgi:hypothetical protein